MRPKDIPEGNQIRKALRAFATEHDLQGVSSMNNLNALVEQIVESKRRVRYMAYLAARANDRTCSMTHSIGFDPFKAAVVAKRSGDLDEACWLVFLATHFGKARRNGWLVVGRVYGALGDKPYWTWRRVTSNPAAFVQWYSSHWHELVPSTGAAFGNHRKYESLRSDSSRSFVKVVESYIRIISNFGSHGELLQSATDYAEGDPACAFDFLYEQFKPLLSFGRTARFDLLSSLSKLQILPVFPGHPYLLGATGPLRGARLLCHGSVTARAPTSELTSILVSLGDQVQLRMDVLEDALCNWQKNPSRFIPFRG